MKDFDVVFEDPYLVIINKPVGVVVNRAASVRELTVQDWAEQRLSITDMRRKFLEEGNVLLEAGGKFEQVDTDWDAVNLGLFFDRAGIVHRLDKDTSGLLVIAKTPEVFVRMLRLFREREVTKVYWALVHGIPKNVEGIIDAPIGRLPWDREKFGVLDTGRPSVTAYKVVSSYFQLHTKKAKRSLVKQRKTGDEIVESKQFSEVLEMLSLVVEGDSLQNKDTFSLIHVFPKTGRTHQIRVHMKHLGHSIVGDVLYAGRKTARNDRMWCSRLLLHAAEISFVHPVTGELVNVNAG